MTHRITRTEDALDRDGHPELFVSVEFDHPDTGEPMPYACWVRGTERTADLAALVETWFPQALSRYREAHATPSGTSVTMRQARLALLGAGLLDAIDAAVIAAGPAARIEWEYAQTVDRDWPLVVRLATGLGLNEAQIDALFAAAARL